MRVAVVGNRVGWTREYVHARLAEEKVTRADILLTGGAEGVDTFAQEYAKLIGAQIRIYYPDPEKPSPERYFERNEMIAMNCDKMIAFDMDGGASGTKNAIRHANKHGKEVIIVEDMLD